MLHMSSQFDIPFSVPIISGEEYSAEDVASFLKRIGMESYVETFLHDDITGQDLLAASDDLLTELGVTAARDRLKLRKEFNKTIIKK